MTEKKQIRVLIADDFKALRDVIRLYLERAGDITVVGEAPELDHALELAKSLQPDVIIMNDYLPPVDSALAAALFRQEGISAAMLAVSMNAEPELIRRSLEQGVTGFMHKDEIDRFLVEAIHRIYRGERYLSPKAQEAHDSIQK
jgi:DNA-binding NarL/FixJ family response regulator